jgi:hypothetical protein
MVSESNVQRSRRHGKENQDLHQIKHLVKRQHHEKKAGCRKREKEETELRRGRQGAGRTPEVDPTIKTKNVERVVAEPEVGRGMESSTIREPSGAHDRGSLNRQRRQASKHITIEGGDTKAGVFSSE